MPADLPRASCPAGRSLATVPPHGGDHFGRHELLHPFPAELLATKHTVKACFTVKVHLWTVAFGTSHIHVFRLEHRVSRLRSPHAALLGCLTSLKEPGLTAAVSPPQRGRATGLLELSRVRIQRSQQTDRSCVRSIVTFSAAHA